MNPTMLDALSAANAAHVAGDGAARAALPGEMLPFVITCMDPRLVGRVIPALGLQATPPPQAKFAGAVIRAGDVAGARSVLAAAIFNVASEVLVIGHTDCRMGRTTANEIRSGVARLGIPGGAFGGEDPAAWLGAFASERSSVLASVAALRADPRVPAAMPIHGLLFHLESGSIEVLVRGYDIVGDAATSGRGSGPVPGGPPSSFGAPGAFAPLGTAGPMTAGPVSMFGSGPVSLGAPPPPFDPAVPAGPPPPSFAQPPAPAPLAPPPSALPKPKAAPPPPSPPESPPDPHPPAPRPRRGASSPFDRARETLDRLRRDR